MDKNYLLSCFAICIVLIYSYTSCHAQVELEDPGIEIPRPKCFTLNEAGLSVGFGFLGELGFATGNLSAPYFSETEDNSLPIGAALSLNLYSPNSILNFSLRALYAGGDQYIKLEDQAAVLSYNRLELPLLARLNFKKDVSSTTSFLVQGGPSYVHYFNSSTSLSEEVQPLSNQHICLTGGIGLEFQYEKTEDGSLIPRSAIELNYSHPLESNISPEFNTLSGSFINNAVETTRMGYINLSVHIYTR